MESIGALPRRLAPCLIAHSVAARPCLRMASAPATSHYCCVCFHSASFWSGIPDSTVRGKKVGAGFLRTKVCWSRLHRHFIADHVQLCMQHRASTQPLSAVRWRYASTTRMTLCHHTMAAPHRYSPHRVSTPPTMALKGTHGCRGCYGRLVCKP